MDSGNIFEDYLIERFKSAKLYITSQHAFTHQLDDETRISGRMDVIIKDPDRNKVVSLEIKAVNGYKAEEIWGGIPSKTNYDLLPLPRASNLMQAMLYKDYVDTKILTQSKFNTEIKKWIDFI